MSMNIAQKRALKARKRKQALAAKRKAEVLEATLPRRVARAAAGAIVACRLGSSFGHVGMATLRLARKSSDGEFVVAFFLLDGLCLGVKDSFLRSYGVAAYEEMNGFLDEREPAEEIEPAYARKLLHALVAWSRAIGFEPHGDYAAIEAIFGEVDAESCDATFTFGKEGKPLHVPGPNDGPEAASRVLARLQSALGPDGFRPPMLPIHSVIRPDRSDDAAEPGVPA